MTAAPERIPLSRERLLRSAIALADADGLPAVTMRGLAAEVGVEAMSLYHHVQGKDALLDGLVEALLSEIETEIAADEKGAELSPGAWRESVRRRCLSARRVMVRHRWAPGLIGSRHTIPPAMFAYFETILATFVEGGVSYRLAHQALHALGSMALGFAQELFSPASAGGSVDDEAAEAELAAMAGAFPHLTAMVAAELHDHAEDPLGWCDSQREFEFTLDLLLDGLERAAASESVAASE